MVITDIARIIGAIEPNSGIVFADWCTGMD